MARNRKAGGGGKGCPFSCVPLTPLILRDRSYPSMAACFDEGCNDKGQGKKMRDPVGILFACAVMLGWSDNWKEYSKGIREH